MRNKLLVFAAALCVGVVAFLGYRAVTRRAPGAARPQTQSAPPLQERASPADRQIAAAQAAVEKAPQAPAGYNLLATAYMQKARETGDAAFYARAEAALKKSFEVAPDNHEATRIQSYLLLAYHRFGEALEVARRSVAQKPEDYQAYGALVDALVELGKYDEARVAVQQAVDARPYTASYARASYLRSLYGDTEGAIEAMRLAAQSASPADPEGVAWCLVHLGDELTNAGRTAEAEREYDRALYVFPDYHLALAAKARARLAAGDANAAVEFYKRAQERVPLPDTAAALGDLYAKLGRQDEAKRQYELVEFTERTSAAPGTYSRFLASFWADHDMKLDEALAIARKERETRADIYTSDTLAWCLYKKGQLAEARAAIDEALRLGTRDPRLLYHAGMIYKALGERQTAAKYLKGALAINPSFDVLQADVAKQALNSLNA